MFLKVPLRLHHALLVVSELAAAGRQSLSLQEISLRTGVTQGYLEQIVAPLRRAGIVSGRRGAGGGYRLAKPAARLSVAAIVEAVEGPIAVVECLSNGQGCRISRGCRSRDVWQGVQSLIIGSLKKVSVARLIGDRKKRLYHA